MVRLRRTDTAEKIGQQGDGEPHNATHLANDDDAAYVALAETLNADLVTTDRKLVAAPGVRCRIRDLRIP